MYELNVDELLKPISADKPCGEDLSYDPEFTELERLIPGKPEQEMGNVKAPAEEPDWQDIHGRCVALFKRTKDLRVMVYLVLAQARLRGIEGVRDGLTILDQHLQMYWPDLMPPLDVEDDNDPTLRVNAIASMSPPADAYDDPLKFPQRFLEIPLNAPRQLGPITLRQIMISTGELSAGAEEKALAPAEIEAAFSDTPPQRLSALYQGAVEALHAWDSIDKTLTAHVGPGRGADLRGTRKIIHNWATQIQKRLSTSAQAAADETANASAESVAATSAAGRAVERGINSRDDCIRAIDDICRYLEAAEPSSPAPMILRRARKLINMSFLDVIADLSPDALAAIKSIGGLDREG
ncbi:MAG: type VI secretion system protein TssA [Phycisphaerae bacterium]